MKHSDSSEHLPVAAKLALHLPLWLSRFARQSQVFRVKRSVQFVTLRHDQQPRKTCNVNQQRVSHSFRRVSRSFQIHHPTSLTLVLTSFALVPDSQLAVAINRGLATTVLSEHHNKEQRILAQALFAHAGEQASFVVRFFLLLPW